MKKLKFWDIRPILNTKSDINMVIGQRSNGKTYGVLKWFLQEFKRTGRTFAYIRRWAEDIKTFRCEQLFTTMTADIEKIFGVGYSIYYYRHRFYLIDPDGKKKGVVGYALSLSESAHSKSTTYDGIGYILMDEFIQMSGEATCKDEMSKFQNVISTLCRSKTDVKIFLCANTVSKFSPYFVFYGFQVDKCEQGTITTKEYPTDAGILRVSLEYCEYNESVGKNVSKYTQSGMISKGQWEIQPTSDIPSTMGERVKERLLFTIYDPTAQITIGCFFHLSKWETLETTESGLTYTKSHTRSFLVLKLTDRKSKYYHLTCDKSLDYNTYNDLNLMLERIKDETEIDVINELYMGRIFSDNMFTADYFLHCWTFYGAIAPRALL